MKTIESVLLVLLCAGCATYQTKKSAINGLVGVRSLENSDFDEVDDATVYGVEGLLGITYTGLGVEAGYTRAKHDGGPLFSGSGSSDVKTDELYLGLRNTWNTDGTVQPYVGAGASWMDANAEASSGFNDDDNSIAGYAHAGVGWMFTPNFQIGLDGRAMVGSDLKFDNEDTDLDYLQIAAFIGFSW